MPAIRPLLAAATVLAAVLACTSVEEPSDGTDSIAPFVTSLAPPPGAGDVPVTTAITVRFSEPINPTTVGPASFALWKGFDAVPGTYAFGDSSMSFVPNGHLAFSTSFSVTVSRGIRDPAGNQLARDTSWGFRTVSEGTPATAAR